MLLIKCCTGRKFCDDDDDDDDDDDNNNNNNNNDNNDSIINNNNNNNDNNSNDSNNSNNNNSNDINDINDSNDSNNSNNNNDDNNRLKLKVPTYSFYLNVTFGFLQYDCQAFGVPFQQKIDAKQTCSRALTSRGVILFSSKTVELISFSSLNAPSVLALR
jgi:cobalamin biosynthesis protein CobT